VGSAHRREPFAVCGFDVRLGSVSIALDAALIRWHQAGGPETESNGLALCVLHHKTFDLGAFTVAEGVLLVSNQANALTGFQEALLAYHGRPIRDPQHPDRRPEPRHLDAGLVGLGVGRRLPDLPSGTALRPDSVTWMP
jgi:putative restriction endonuclease